RWRFQRTPAVIELTFPVGLAVPTSNVEDLAHYGGREASAREPEPKHDRVGLAGPIQIPHGEPQAASLLLHAGFLDQFRGRCQLRAHPALQLKYAPTRFWQSAAPHRS